MALQALLDAPPVIRLHAYSALAAFGLGGVQFLLPRGKLAHRLRGAVWSVLMLAVAISSFWIKTLFPGHFSPIHLLSIFTLATLPLAVWAVHRGDGKRHGRAMTRLYLGALVVAGAFTLLPGRLMFKVVFGG